ncbi:PTS sugar transporter subunit IIC [Amygdalobacter nucleatus]|uniref:PTS sugar transporter subunit IIC n=1 Tax=Amygdalobacter nucleatus TaxID=3029274 RepID=UPI0027A8DA0D|nr:PTS transporter subunit EIIC [Amygdalobacter nucleatus]WEG37140.1 PTS transporter subunit EIIC [Amygdalobacter nucleatus]
MVKFLDGFTSKLLMWGEMISQQRHLKAIRDGMVAATPLALLGGMTLIVTSPPVNLKTMQATNFVFKLLIMWKQWAVENGLAVELLFRASMGMMALFICLAIANSLAKSYKMNEISQVVIAGVSFLLSAAPSNLAVMQTVLSQTKDIQAALKSQVMAIPMTYLGAEGIFTAIIVALLTVELSRLLTKGKIYIKLPESVPAPVQASFASIIPLVFNALLVFFLSLFVQKTTNGMLIPDLVKSLFKPLVVAIDSPLGIVLISVVTQILWLAGLHGSSIVSGLIGAFEIGNLVKNAEVVSQGMMPEFVYTEPFRAFFMILGGAGATLALNIIMLRSSSKQLRTLGKLAIVPSIFNINEPLIFGLPIVLNPILALPFILVQTINGLLTYFVMRYDVLAKTFTYVPWTTPAPIGAALSTMSIGAFFWVMLLVILDMIIWYPFYKTYEKQLNSQDN